MRPPLQNILQETKSSYVNQSCILFDYFIITGLGDVPKGTTIKHKMHK